MNLSRFVSIVLIGLISVNFILILLVFIGQQNLYAYFTYSYSLIAIIGGGLLISHSRYWVWVKSYLGLTFTLLGTSLVFQYLGQLTCNSYRLLQNIDKCPYPSYAEFFFIGSIFLYIIAAYTFSKAIGLSINLRTYTYKLFALAVSILMIGLAYYKFAEINEIQTLSDINLLINDYGILYLVLELLYPFGAGAYTIFAILAIFLTVNTYQSKMFIPSILILIGLFTQFMGDTLFVWTEGYISDMFYLISYSSIATIGIYLNNSFSATNKKRPNNG